MVNYAKGFVFGLMLLSISPFIRSAVSQEKNRVHLFFGVYTQHYGLTQALENYDVKISNAKSNGVVDFPSDADIALTKMMILSDVSGAEFSQEQTDKIKTYVQNGGKLLVLGGPFTLGVGRLDKFGLDAILPVYLNTFDLKWENSGAVFTKEVNNYITENLDLSANPKVYWIHAVSDTLRGANSQIIMKAGAYPLLISGVSGTGKVFVFTGTPMGNPEEGDVPFWTWQGWQDIVRRIAEIQ